MGVDRRASVWPSATAASSVAKSRDDERGQRAAAQLAEPVDVAGEAGELGLGGVEAAARAACVAV